MDELARSDWHGLVIRQIGQEREEKVKMWGKGREVEKEKERVSEWMSEWAKVQEKKKKKRERRKKRMLWYKQLNDVEKNYNKIRS